MPRTLPTKAARKQAFELKSAQLEVDIAHATWQHAYVPVSDDVLAPTRQKQDTSLRWYLEILRLTYELAQLRLAYVTEEARIAALKSARASRNRGA